MNKISPLSKRNPVARSLANPLFRKRIEKSKKELARKNDPWDRKSKWKGKENE